MTTSAQVRPAPGPVSPSNPKYPVLFLAAQIRALGDLMETLTLRLLDMEDRLGCLELQLGRLVGHSDQAGVDSAAVLDLLEQTDERLIRLEAFAGSVGRPRLTQAPTSPA